MSRDLVYREALEYMQKSKLLYSIQIADEFKQKNLFKTVQNDSIYILSPIILKTGSYQIIKKDKLNDKITDQIEFPSLNDSIEYIINVIFDQSMFMRLDLPLSIIKNDFPKHTEYFYSVGNNLNYKTISGYIREELESESEGIFVAYTRPLTTNEFKSHDLTPTGHKNVSKIKEKGTEKPNPLNN